MKRPLTIACVQQAVSGKELEKAGQAALCAAVELTEQYLKADPVLSPGARKAGRSSLSQENIRQGVRLWARSTQ